MTFWTVTIKTRRGGYSHWFVEARTARIARMKARRALLPGESINKVTEGYSR
jgi:hypothetical protein